MRTHTATQRLAPTTPTTLTRRQSKDDTNQRPSIDSHPISPFPENQGPTIAFRGTQAISVIQRRPSDREVEGLVEWANGCLETAFPPGRRLDAPAAFTPQLDYVCRPVRPVR